MTLNQLKDFIESKNPPTDFMIFERKENKFLARQYTQALCELYSNNINKIASLQEPKQSSFMLLTQPEDEYLNILTVDTFTERAENYGLFDHTLVICDQVDKSIRPMLSSYIITFPKLQTWQMFDYVKQLCPSLEDSEINWLITATGQDIEALINEVTKITPFAKNEQKAVFNELRFTGNFDKTSIDLFTLVNALVDGDMATLYRALSTSLTEIEPVVLANRVLSSLRNIILVSQNPNLTPTDLGITQKQLYFIKSKYSGLNMTAIKEKLKFLTNFDIALKTSGLELSKKDMLNYLIVNLSYKIN